MDVCWLDSRLALYDCTAGCIALTAMAMKCCTKLE